MKASFIADKYIVSLVGISVAVAFLTHFPEMISLSDPGEQESLFPGMRAIDVANEIFFTFISLLVLFALNTFVFKFNTPSAHITWLKMILSFILTWIVSNLMGQGFVWMHHLFNIPAIDAMVHHYLHPLRDFIITSLVVGSCYMIHLLRESRRVLLENQQLRTENIVNQYEALKNQLNPHMLFNSLNTLQSLIRETPDKAQDYLQELSRVLRYTLQENECQTVSLQEEMQFVRAYIFLLKMRYEDNLLFDIEINAALNNRLLPPMSIQLLIENAVKHNEISNRRPLEIRIRTDADSLIVSNPLQPRLTASGGTRIGLANLAKRYALLFKQEIVIREENEVFTVSIPLI